MNRSQQPSRCKTLSVKMIQKFLYILFLVLCLPLQSLAAVTFGAVPQPDSLIRTEEQAIQLATALQRTLGEPVQLRLFPDEATLHAWLNRYQQVDLAVLTRGYLRQQPAGEFFVMRGTESFGSLDPFVMRQGVTPRVRLKVQTALSSLAADPDIRALFQKRPTPPAQIKTAGKKTKKSPVTAQRAKPREKTVAKPATPAATEAPAPRSDTQPAQLPEPSQPAQPVAAPPQAIPPPAPRIWLGAGPVPPAAIPEETGERGLPASATPEKGPDIVQPSPVNPYSRANPLQPSVASPSATGAQGVWFGALLVGVALAAFLFWRSRREKTTWAPRPLPIRQTAAGTTKTEGFKEQGYSVPVHTAAQAVVIETPLHTPLDYNQEEPVKETLAEAESIAPSAEAETVEASTKGPSEEEPFLPAGEPESTPPLDASRPVAGDFTEPAEALTDNRWLADVEDIRPEPDIDSELKSDSAMVPPWEETSLEVDLPELDASPVEDDLPQTLNETVLPWLEDSAELITAATESSALPAPAEFPEAAGEDRSFLPFGEAETPAEKDAPLDWEENAEKEEPGAPGALQVGVSGGYLSDAAEDVNGVDFYRETIFSVDSAEKPEDAGIFSAESEFSQPEGDPFSSKEIQDTDLPPFSLNDGSELPTIATPDYGDFFQQGETKAPPRETKTTAQKAKKDSPESPVGLRMRGELGRSQVPALLKLISAQSRPGTLIVRTPLGEKRLYFRKGKLAGATSIPLTSDDDVIVNNLAMLLVRQGHLPEKDWYRPLNEAKEMELRPLDALCSAGTLPRETLKRGLGGLITELVFSLILFPRGRFDYLTQKSPIPLQEDLGLDIHELLTDAAQQTIEWRDLRKSISSLETRVEFRPNGREKIQGAKMPRHQERILELIDGNRSIQEISYQAQISELEVAKFLFVMDKAKIILLKK